MKMKHHILLLSCAALLSPFAAQAQAQTAATETAATESQKLSALFAADDEASLQRNPLERFSSRLNRKGIPIGRDF
jgi:hypothetical protein